MLTKTYVLSVFTKAPYSSLTEEEPQLGKTQKSLSHVVLWKLTKIIDQVKTALEELKPVLAIILVKVRNRRNNKTVNEWMNEAFISNVQVKEKKKGGK